MVTASGRSSTASPFPATFRNQVLELFPTILVHSVSKGIQWRLNKSYLLYKVQNSPFHSFMMGLVSVFIWFTRG